jgi:hypothetical protein
MQRRGMQRVGMGVVDMEAMAVGVEVMEEGIRMPGQVIDIECLV